MNITLANFQRIAIDRLMDAMEGEKHTIILKSCTGSGKTIILTHFMDEYLKSFGRTVFVWLTPGKGFLEEQSKEKMDRYIHNSQTKLLSDVMTGGFRENDVCFINWEKLTKKGNIALKDGERTNFLEHIQRAHDNGLRFCLIVDESHQHDTGKANSLMDYFLAKKIIRCSATPKIPKTQVELIEIPEAEVIAAGLIKRRLIINENFPSLVETDSEVAFLLERAFAKQQALRAAFLSRDAIVNPLIVVQVPNNSDLLQDEIERYFQQQGVTYENRQLAIWLAERKENLEGISEPDAEPIAVIIKQAVATGWDCPRAHILVKMRDNMDETFEIQTIGRIRRMPKAQHYENELLDYCYLYTLDRKFTENVQKHLGNGATDAATLRLKEGHKGFRLPCEQKTAVPLPRDPIQALNTVRAYFIKMFGLWDDKDISNKRAEENRKLLESHGFIFDEKILKSTLSGHVDTLEKGVNAKLETLHKVDVAERIDSHHHGRAYHHEIGKISRKLLLEYSEANAIIRRLFDGSVKSPKRLLFLHTRAVYAFVLNNCDRILDAFRQAMAVVSAQDMMPKDPIRETEFRFPAEYRFEFDPLAKEKSVLEKNVYPFYRRNAAGRSDPEKKFEWFCETCPAVDWFYKNGDKGDEFFSIVYHDAFGKQKSFYPDYIVQVHGEIWIIETKGGFDRNDNSQDIDRFSPQKFQTLKAFLDKHHLRGGFVREQSPELYLCEEGYDDDIKADHWRRLVEVWK